MNLNVFPATTKSLPISATATASSSTALPNVGNVLRVVNEGPNVAFIHVTTGAAVATLPNATPTVTSVPVMVGDTVLSIPDALSTTPLNISAICRAGGTAQLVVCVGEGL